MTSYTTNSYPLQNRSNSEWAIHSSYTTGNRSRHCNRLITGCISLLFFLPLLLPAQYLKSYIGPSPNAASLGTYGQIPVSEYSGVPNIQIPLYSIETEGFSMPISLSYHAATLKNSDEASWVGFGWSLNAGGVITRCKRDQNDFGTNGFFRTTSSRPCSDNVDQEPDMFYYNIGSRSGKFMILGPSSSPTIRYFTRDNIKITYSPGIETWTLVTGEGVTYYFGKHEFAHETTTGASSSSEGYVSSWYVTGIQLVNGTRINFSYLTPNNTETSKKITWGEEDHVNAYSPLYAVDNCCSEAHQALIRRSNWSTTTINIDEVILSKIEFPNGVIKLNTSARTDLAVKEGTAAAKKLDNIEVYSLQKGAEQLIKTFTLSYDYYYCRSFQIPPVPGSRLRLQQIKESTPDATFKPYTLTYGKDTLPAMGAGSTSFLGITGLLSSIVYPTGGSSIFIWEPVQIAQSNFTQIAGARIKKIYDRNAVDSCNVRRYEYSGGKLMGQILNGYSVPYSITQPLNNCCNMPPMTLVVTRTRYFFSDFSSLSETANGHVFGHDKVITWYGENGENGKKESIFENTAPTNPNYMQGSILIPVPLNVSNKNGLLKEEWEYRNDNGAFKPATRVINTYASADIVVTPARRHAFDKCSWAYDITTEWVQQAGQGVYTYDMTGTSYVYVNTNYYYDDPDNALPTRLLSTDSKGKSMQVTNMYVKEKSVQSGGIYTSMLNKHIISPVIEQEKTRNTLTLSRTVTSYKDWFNNGRVIKPEIVEQKKGTSAAEIMVRYHDYDESGNVLALSKEKGKTVSYIWGYGNAYPIAEITNVDHEPRISYTTKTHNVGSFLNLTANSNLNFEPFTTNYAQTYNFSIRFMPAVTSGTTFNGSVEVMLRNSAGAILYSTYLYQDNTYTGSVTLPNGTNSYYFTASVISPGTNTHLIRLDVSSTFQVKNTSYNYFHTSFEEMTSGFVSDSKTGKQCLKGPYTIGTNRKPGNYIVSWWQKPVTGGNWVYQEQLITITTGSPDVTAGTTDLLIDEVRLYPQDAFMTTYTYQPQVGMTSKCDERGQVMYYEYDALNRLTVIRDNNNNIVKMIEYNYRNN